MNVNNNNNNNNLTDDVLNPILPWLSVYYLKEQCQDFRPQFVCAQKNLYTWTLYEQTKADDFLKPLYTLYHLQLFIKHDIWSMKLKEKRQLF